MKRVKQYIFRMISPRGRRNKASLVYDIILFLAIFISSGCVLVDLFGWFGDYKELIYKLEYWITYFFIFEYALKLWVAEYRYPNKSLIGAKLEFITSFESLVDLVSILAILLNNIPTELAALKLIKVTKLVRLSKVSELMVEDKEGDTRGQRVKNRVYEIICKDKEGDILSKIYDICSITLIILSVITLFVDTFNVGVTGKNILHTIEYVVAALFTVEYVVRIWTASVEYPDCDPDTAKMKYIFSFMALIDLLSILPVFLTTMDSTLAIVKIFKLLKILRLVKMSRYLSGIHSFVTAVVSKKKQIMFSVMTIVFLMLLCSIFIYGFEHTEQPDVFQNAFSGIKYSFVILTGIGDSSIELVTTLGKTFSTVMTILGVCIFAVPITIVTDEFMNVSKDSAENSEKKRTVLDISEFDENDQKLIVDIYNRMKNK